jgi:hypothetical protein
MVFLRSPDITLSRYLLATSIATAQASDLLASFA